MFLFGEMEIIKPDLMLEYNLKILNLNKLSN